MNDTEPLRRILGLYTGPGKDYSEVVEAVKDDCRKVLRGRQYEALEYRLGFGGREHLSRKDTAERMGVCSERVAQLENAALNKLMLYCANNQAKETYFFSGDPARVMIQDVGLPVVVANSLMRVGVNSLDDLVKYSSSDLKKALPELGQVRTEEVKKILGGYGLALKRQD